MVRKSNICLATIAVLLSLCHWANAELFTAIVELESLLDTQRRVIDELDNYNKQEETRLVRLQKQVNQHRKEHEKAMADVSDYLGNPINAFTLIKRLTTDLKAIEKSIKQGTEFNMTMTHPDVKYPTSEDLIGAAQALTRLQATYRLDVNKLSEGMLDGDNGLTHTPMTTDDCFGLGKTLYYEKEYKNAITWMIEALRKYREGDNEDYSYYEVDILEYIAYAHYLFGDVKAALDWTNQLLVLDPNHVRARGNALNFTATIKKEAMKNSTGDPKQEVADEKSKDDIGQKEWDPNDFKTYEALCRGDLELATEITKNLKCWYNNKNHAFLKYAPIKVEQVYIQPDMFVFHGVLSDNEINLIKNLTMRRFERSTVFGPSGKKIDVPYRISKVTWLADKESPIVARVSQRVSDMTGLSLITSEDFQVLNYGIGGHYTPHYDFASKENSAFAKSLGRFGGNRIATLLFYMSDVAQGGATVFPEIFLSVFPMKGAAAFWLNLHPSGEGDMATKHGACPVLRGTKWAANKWLHLGGQEFLRPCNLEYQTEGIAGKKLQPVMKKTSR